MGEYMQQVLTPEYGFDIQLKTDPNQFNRIYEFKDIGFWASLKNSWKDQENGKYSSLGFWDTCSFMSVYSTSMGEMDKTLGQGNRKAEAEEMKGLGMDFHNVLKPEFYQAEIISALSMGTARGLGKLAAFMANKGKLGEQQLMSEASWDVVHADPTYQPMLPECMGTFFTTGGLGRFDHDELLKQTRHEFFGQHKLIPHLEWEEHSKRKGFYGWFGAGGSVLQWNPDSQIGFGYVPSDMVSMDYFNFRGSTLQEVAAKCAAACASE